jgi:thymidylate synthase
MCEEAGYLSLLSNVLNYGEKRTGRNGNTVSLFGEKLEFNLKTGFPLLTTKKVFLRGIAEELFWFLRGSTNANELSAKNVHIWDGNTSRTFLDSVGLYHLMPGYLGAGYGHCWRSFGGDYPSVPGSGANCGVDQIRFILEELTTNPHGRRALLSAWNPCQLSKAALPPCHYAYQFYINVNGLSCICNCRSQDLCAGTPFNIASTALLTHLIAHLLHIDVDRVILMMGDAHIYDEHNDGAHEQIDRIPKKKPTLRIVRDAPPRESSIDEKIKWLETLKFEDIQVTNYDSYPAIKYAMIA